MRICLRVCVFSYTSVFFSCGRGLLAYSKGIPHTMSSRQGGKQKPLKAPKKERMEDDDDDVAFKQKMREQQKAEKDAIAKLKSGKK
ncbi:hypothetical protein TRSC58_07122 [Trypanosoma rangeli SC58]|uniref:Translation machinery associated TMA7 n=1 Tax=Trypanosoma rangeli SC58 TaxID=429131 RepID=A0A061IRU7_TRYRA|nr:hypothetical protein TRSC58_07122 [Trypanosoma rangeli SC58]